MLDRWQRAGLQAWHPCVGDDLNSLVWGPCKEGPPPLTAYRRHAPCHKHTSEKEVTQSVISNPLSTFDTHDIANEIMHSSPLLPPTPRHSPKKCRNCGFLSHRSSQVGPRAEKSQGQQRRAGARRPRRSHARVSPASEQQQSEPGTVYAVQDMCLQEA